MIININIILKQNLIYKIKLLEVNNNKIFKKKTIKWQVKE